MLRKMEADRIFGQNYRISKKNLRYPDELSRKIEQGSVRVYEGMSYLLLTLLITEN